MSEKWIDYKKGLEQLYETNLLTAGAYLARDNTYIGYVLFDNNLIWYHSKTLITADNFHTINNENFIYKTYEIDDLANYYRQIQSQ